MQWYAPALANAFGSVVAGNAPNIDYLSDNIYAALVTAGVKLVKKRSSKTAALDGL